MTLVLVIGMVGAGAFAYFSDVEESTGNVFQAGTLDLAVNGENPWVSKAFTFYDVKPCEELAPFDITFKNVGQNDGILTFSISYVENDKPEDVETWFEFSAANDSYWEMGANKFASLVYVKAVKHEYCSSGVWRDDLDNWKLGMDGNGDGYVSLYEMMLASPIQWGDTPTDPLPAGDWSTFRITFHLGDSLTPFQVGGDIVLGVPDNRPQADGVDVTVTATLTQVP